jgi:hypothetical protein
VIFGLQNLFLRETALSLVAMSEKSESKKEDDLEKRLVDLHPKFLERIREVYPLAVLGSLCIAIGAFSSQPYPDAQPYAISAASLFLIAFAFSFLVKIVPNYFIVLISYVSTAMAVVFLFLVVGVFANAIPMVGKSVSVIPDVTSLIIFLMFGYFFYRFHKRIQPNIFRLYSTIAEIAVSFAAIYYLIDLLAKLVGFSPPDFMIFVFLLSSFVLATMGLLIVVTDFRDKKKRKEGEKVS